MYISKAIYNFKTSFHKPDASNGIEVTGIPSNWLLVDHIINLEDHYQVQKADTRVSCDLAFKTKIKMVITEIKIFLIPSNIGNSCLFSCTNSPCSELNPKILNHKKRSSTTSC